MPYIFYFFSNLSEHFRLKYLEWGSFKNNSFKKIPRETGMVVFSGKISELSVGHWQRLLLHEVCRPAQRSDAWAVEAACVWSARGEACIHGVLGLGPALRSWVCGGRPWPQHSAQQSGLWAVGVASLCAVFGVQVASSPLACRGS